MSYNNLEDALLEEIASLSFREKDCLTPDMKLADIDIDSLDLTYLVMFLEDTLRISIDEAEFEKVKTVGDFLKLGSLVGSR